MREHPRWTRVDPDPRARLRAAGGRRREPSRAARRARLHRGLRGGEVRPFARACWPSPTSSRRSPRSGPTARQCPSTRCSAMMRRDVGTRVLRRAFGALETYVRRSGARLSRPDQSAIASSAASTAMGSCVAQTTAMPRERAAPQEEDGGARALLVEARGRLVEQEQRGTGASARATRHAAARRRRAGRRGRRGARGRPRERRAGDARRGRRGAAQREELDVLGALRNGTGRAPGRRGRRARGGARQIGAVEPGQSRRRPRHVARRRALEAGEQVQRACVFPEPERPTTAVSARARKTASRPSSTVRALP